MIRVSPEDFEKPIKASFELFAQPSHCFTRAEDGYLTCAGQGAFSYWFLVTLFECLIFLIPASTSKFYNVWYFAFVLGVSAIRVLCFGALWVIIGYCFNLWNKKALLSICLFSSSLLSLPGYVLLLFPYSKLTLEQVISTTSPENLASNPLAMSDIKFFIASIGLTFVLGWIYVPKYLSGVYDISIERAVAYYFVLNLAYAIIRPFTVAPLYALALEHLGRAPWSVST
jgi:hypothetical protein